MSSKHVKASEDHKPALAAAAGTGGLSVEFGLCCDVASATLRFGACAARVFA